MFRGTSHDAIIKIEIKIEDRNGHRNRGADSGRTGMGRGRRSTLCVAWNSELCRGKGFGGRRRRERRGGREGGSAERPVHFYAGGKDRSPLNSRRVFPARRRKLSDDEF